MSVKQNIKNAIERAHVIMSEEGWYDVTKGGSGKPGDFWEEVNTGKKKSANMDYADHSVGRHVGIEYKFTQLTTPFTLFHKSPVNWKSEVLPQLFEVYGTPRKNPEFVGERRIYVMTSKSAKKRRFMADRDGDRLILRSLDPRVSDAVWDAAEIRDATAKLNHVILGYGVVRKRNDGTKWVKYTGYRHLSRFVGGVEFLERIVSGVVGVEMEASESHDHGPKFRLAWKDLGSLWGSIDTFGDVEVKNRRDQPPPDYTAPISTAIASAAATGSAASLIGLPTTR